MKHRHQIYAAKDMHKSVFNRKLAIILSVPLIVIAILLYLALAYCSQFIEHSAFLDNNDLGSTEEVYEFVTRELEKFSDDITSIQNYTTRFELDCYDAQERPEAITNTLTQVESDSVITCIIPISNGAFLGIENIISGKLSICYFDPHLRMNFRFLNNTFVELTLDIITAEL